MRAHERVWRVGSSRPSGSDGVCPNQSILARSRAATRTSTKGCATPRRANTWSLDACECDRSTSPAFCSSASSRSAARRGAADALQAWSPSCRSASAAAPLQAARGRWAGTGRSRRSTCARAAPRRRLRRIGRTRQQVLEHGAAAFAAWTSRATRASSVDALASEVLRARSGTARVRKRFSMMLDGQPCASWAAPAAALAVPVCSRWMSRVNRS